MENKRPSISTLKEMKTSIIKQIAANIVPQELIGHKTRIHTIKFSPDGNKIMSGTRNNASRTIENISVWNIKTHKKLFNLMENYERISSISFSPDGKQILSSSYGYNDNKNNLAIWDAQTGAMILNLVDKPAVFSATFTPDGKKIISQDRHNDEHGEKTGITMWDAQTGKELFAISCDLQRLLTLSPDGTKFATHASSFDAPRSQHNYYINIWDTATGTKLLKINSSYMDTLAFSPDNTKIIANSNHNIIIWDAQTGKQLSTLNYLPQRRQFIMSAQFSPSGKYIAADQVTRHDKENLIMWDAHNDKKLFTLTIGNHPYIGNIFFTPDDNYVITCNAEKNGAITVWDTKTGEKLFDLIGHESAIYSMALSPDGNTIVASAYNCLSDSYNLMVWNMPFDLITSIRNELNKQQIKSLYRRYSKWYKLCHKKR